MSCFTLLCIWGCYIVPSLWIFKLTWFLVCFGVFLSFVFWEQTVSLGRRSCSEVSKLCFLVSTLHLSRFLLLHPSFLTKPSILIWYVLYVSVTLIVEDPCTARFQHSGSGKEIQVQDFTLYGSIHWPLNAVKLSCRKTTTTYVSNSGLDYGDDVLRVIFSISFPQNMEGRVDATAQFWFNLTTVFSPKPSQNHLDVHWQN